LWRLINSAAFFLFARYKYHLLLHFIVVIYGFTGILGKLIPLKAIPIVCFRTLIAFVGLSLALPFLKTSFRLHSAKKLFALLGIGIIVALHWVTFYHSIHLSTASLGILCLATTTLHVAWLEPLLIKRPFSLLEFVLSLIVVAGIYFVSGDFNAQEYEALAFGLSSAFLAALFSVLNAKVAENCSPVHMTLYEMLAAFLFLLGVLFFSGNIDASLFQLDAAAIGWLIFLGLVCTSFAFLATIYVMKRLGAFTVSLSINMEPVYTIILAIFILNENQVLNGRFYIGSVVIIAVVLANAFLKSAGKKKHKLPA
jgi:drug/metabolite transporter (DMT)-like permease